MSSTAHSIQKVLEYIALLCCFDLDLPDDCHLVILGKKKLMMMVTTTTMMMIIELVLFCILLYFS
jgi:hypothetical protein